KLLATLTTQGVIIGVEVRALEPPDLQVTLILPGAGAQPGPFLAAMRLAASMGKVEAKEVKVGNRAVQHIAAEQVHLVWWADGKDAVVAIGTDKPEAVVKRAHGQTPRLAENSEFKKLQQFKEFETGTRAFVDGAALVKLAKSRGKEVSKIIDDLGLDGLKAVRFHSGFEGPAERSLIEVDMPAPRKGILTLANGKPFKLGDLPAMPPDVITFSATRFDWAGFYDTGIQAVQAIVGVVAPEELPKVKEGLKQADAILGINLRTDLLGELGDMLVTYNSPSEGLFSLGQT